MVRVQTATRFFSLPPDKISPHDEAAFFTSLKTGNATFKRTRPGRFRDVDALMLGEVGAAGAALSDILDVGISSGTTTLELLMAARAAGHDPRMTATDRSLTARLVRWPGIGVLLEPSGHVLQYVLFGLPLRAWRRRLDYLTGVALVQALARATLGRVARSATARGHAREVALVSPRLAHAPGVTLVEDDVTRRNPAFHRRFDLVRAANILNRDYFDEDTLRRAAANLIDYMRGSGSWLLVIRTQVDGAQHGTLFRGTDAGGLAVARRFGQGSEIEALLLAAAARSVSAAAVPQSAG